MQTALRAAAVLVSQGRAGTRVTSEESHAVQERVGSRIAPEKSRNQGDKLGRAWARRRDSRTPGKSADLECEALGATQVPEQAGRR